MVEEDEEPPHDVDVDAKKIALLIATALNSKIFREIFPMRKMVIDGSNTTGFQRTMLVSQGGNLQVNGIDVGVQSICLEEDAAKLIGDKGEFREYSLDRLGIPLVEIALDPVEAGPKIMKEVALTLGRLLRTTKKVVRGLGSIRQDVNVSVKGGGVVEVKGVQQLEQLEKVVEFEAKRQDGLMNIAKKLQEIKNFEVTEDDIVDITEDMKNCKSKIVQKSLKNNNKIRAIRFPNFAGMFAYSPYEGIRLGKEIAELVRFYGIGGVFHSDELPNYGIENSDVEMIKKKLKVKENDGFLVIALPKEKYDLVPKQIIERIIKAKDGVPAETRLATQNGDTVFLRPRPGASRMYPETDIPPVIVTNDELSSAKQNVPKKWHEIIA
ncbi:MAG: Glu-tRNA(Gln) amidotransferase subunit GatE, partial [Nitrosopumilaceae archaeon]|nr:Glu-tRNA(Gln) amidotransferase subunit GatE [Nitrosopumilaceae archaeon]